MDSEASPRSWGDIHEQEKIFHSLQAISICHNVTPIFEKNEGDSDDEEMDVGIHRPAVFQASSPDEVKLSNKA